MMTSCTGSACGYSAWRPSSATSGRRVGDGRPPVDLLPLAGAGPALRPGDAPAARAPTAADAQPDERPRRAAGPGLQPRPPGTRPAPDQRDARPGALGRGRHLGQRRLADPPPPRPEPPGLAAQPRRRLRRATAAGAADHPSTETSRPRGSETIRPSRRMPSGSGSLGTLPQPLVDGVLPAYAADSCP